MRRSLTVAAAAATLSVAAITTTTAAAAPDHASGSTKAIRVPSAATATSRARSLATGVAAAATRTTAADRLTARSVVVDRDGTSHVHFDRTYRGLPVRGGDVIVHSDGAGRFEGATQTLTKAVDVSTTPRVSKDAAILDAVASGAAARGADARQATGTLVVEARAGAPKLAWETTTRGTQADGTPSVKVTTVDAATGQVLVSEERIETVGGDGTGYTSGTVPLNTTQSGSTYQLKDPSRGGTYTGDAGNKQDLCLGTLCLSRAPSTVFTDADNHWGNGTLSDRASVAVDAQYSTDVTWDYYKNVHGRNGIAGNGKGSYNRVHYGSKYNNAFWDDSCFCMTYGDGDGTSYNPFASLDVGGHEMSHGVTSNSAGLTYSGESGGLNEATSDIFGTLVEFYAANPRDPGDYLIGEKISKNGQPLRYMDDPSKDGSSAKCWSSSVGNLDVHYSSGVANHFFYLLAVGSGASAYGNSPTCNGSTVTGIGNDAAGKIWYRALTTYMTSGTNYAGARTATLNAAKDLYGQGSTQYNAVAAAWSAVSVN